MAKSAEQVEWEWQELKAQMAKPPFCEGAEAILAAARLRPNFLAEGRIPRGEITFLVGPPGASKSWLGYSLAVALAQGAPAWLGLPLMTSRGPLAAPERVLILNYDNPRGELGRRLRRLGMRPDDPILFHSPIFDPLRLPASHEELLALVTVTRPSLVLVDSLRQAHSADENSSGEMAKIMSHFKSWAALGPAVVIVHHSNKSEISSGTNAVRGSVEIVASADAVVEVALPVEGVSEAKWSKHRSWPMASSEETLQFEVRDDGDSTRVESMRRVLGRRGPQRA